MGSGGRPRAPVAEGGTDGTVPRGAGAEGGLLSPSFDFSEYARYIGPLLEESAGKIIIAKLIRKRQQKKELEKA
jgi:hypothetical protein